MFRNLADPVTRATHRTLSLLVIGGGGVATGNRSCSSTVVRELENCARRLAQVEPMEAGTRQELVALGEGAELLKRRVCSPDVRLHQPVVARCRAGDASSDRSKLRSSGRRAS